MAVLSTDEGIGDRTFVLGVAAVPLLAPRAYARDSSVLLPAVVARSFPLGLWFAAVRTYGLYAVANVLLGSVRAATSSWRPPHPSSRACGGRCCSSDLRRRVAESVIDSGRLRRFQYA